MEQENSYSEQFLRKRKMMLMVPLLVVPMLCMAFYGLGGGKADKAGVSKAVQQKGLNMTLPLPHFDARTTPQDKQAFYEKAKADSLRLQQSKSRDPYASGKIAAAGGGADTAFRMAGVPGDVHGLQGIDGGSADRQADQVMDRVNQLRQMLGKSGPGFGQGSAGVPGASMFGRAGEGPYPGFAGPGAGPDTSAVSRAQARIRALMDQIKGAAPGQGDPEMNKYDAMLDKLIRIQHPELVRPDTSALPGSSVALVRPPRPDDPVSSLASDGGPAEDQDGFMEIGQSDAADSGREQAIEAVINDDQTLTAGSTVALRIVRDVTVNGEHVPAGQLIYGLANLNGERLTVSVTSIRVGQSIVPVSLQVYDLDGLPGIRVPGAISRDVSKESADQALNGLQMASVDPSLGAQAASAGLEFARSLASKKIRLVRVSLPAGYRVLLKNGKSNTRL
jgi:Conjugative transposon, TraM